MPHFFMFTFLICLLIIFPLWLITRKRAEKAALLAEFYVAEAVLNLFFLALIPLIVIFGAYYLPTLDYEPRHSDDLLYFTLCITLLSCPIYTLFLIIFFIASFFIKPNPDFLTNRPKRLFLYKIGINAFAFYIIIFLTAVFSERHIAGNHKRIEYDYSTSNPDAPGV